MFNRGRFSNAFRETEKYTRKVIDVLNTGFVDSKRLNDFVIEIRSNARIVLKWVIHSTHGVKVYCARS